MDLYDKMSIVKNLAKRYNQISYCETSEEQERNEQAFIAELCQNGFVGWHHFCQINKFVQFIDIQSSGELQKTLSEEQIRKESGGMNLKELTAHVWNRFKIESEIFDYCLKVLTHLKDYDKDQINEVLDFVERFHMGNKFHKTKDNKNLTPERLNEMIKLLKEKAPDAEEICKDEPKTARGKLDNFFEFMD